MNIMFDDLKNSIDYYIRSHTKFSRKNYKGEVNNDEAAYVFDILTRYMNPKPEGSLKVLDIGSKIGRMSKESMIFLENIVIILLLMVWK